MELGDSEPVLPNKGIQARKLLGHNVMGIDSGDSIKTGHSVKEIPAVAGVFNRSLP